MTDIDDIVMAQMLYVDAIVGAGFPTIPAALKAEAEGLAASTGDQHNPSWAWRRSALENLPLPTVAELYVALKQAALATAADALLGRERATLVIGYRHRPSFTGATHFTRPGTLVSGRGYDAIHIDADVERRETRAVFDELISYFITRVRPDGQLFVGAERRYPPVRPHASQ